jgi:hypothetical protein
MEGTPGKSWMFRKQVSYLFPVPPDTKNLYSCIPPTLAICQILSSSNSGHSLLSFLPSENLDQLAEHLLSLLIRSTTDDADFVRVLQLGVKLNLASVLRTVKLESIIAEEVIYRLKESCSSLTTSEYMSCSNWRGCLKRPWRPTIA